MLDTSEMVIDRPDNNINILQENSWQSVQPRKRCTGNQTMGIRQCITRISSDVIGSRSRVIKCKPLPSSKVRKKLVRVGVGTTVGKWCVKEILHENGHPSTLVLTPTMEKAKWNNFLQLPPVVMVQWSAASTEAQGSRPELQSGGESHQQGGWIPEQALVHQRVQARPRRVGQRAQGAAESALRRPSVASRSYAPPSCHEKWLGSTGGGSYQQ